MAITKKDKSNKADNGDKNKEVKRKDYNLQKWAGFDDDMKALKEKTFAGSAAQGIKIAVKKIIETN